MSDLQIAIAGTGALGESLARSLKQAGFPIHSILSRKAHTARELAEKVSAQFFVGANDELPEGIQLLFLCVPDDAIASASSLLADLPYAWSDVCVAHTSGALTASSLSALADEGAHVFSFHPMQTFVKGHVGEWKGIFVGIEGDEAGVLVGKEVASALGSTSLMLNAEDKALYHASAVFASNFMVALAGIATDILSKLDVSREDAFKLLGPLIERTCKNIITAGPDQVLTGPASRGDIQTIKRHAEALGNSLPDKYHIYLGLTREAVDLKLRNDKSFSLRASMMYQVIEQLLNE